MNFRSCGNERFTGSGQRYGMCEIEIVQNVPFESKTNNLLHDNRKIKLLPEGKQ